MAIKLQCACGKNLSVKDEFAGRRVKCPGCQTLLRVPKPKVEEAAFGDEWDLGDSAEDNWDEEPSKARAKSRGGKSSSKPGSNSRQTSAKPKGKKLQSSNRGLLIGLSAGGGLLGIALLGWMLWPAKPEEIAAVAPNQSTSGSESTTGGDATSSTSPTSANPGSQPNASLASSSAPTPINTTKLEGDLSLLQGTWQVSDLGVAADQPGAAEMIATSKLLTLTIEDDILTMVTPGGAAMSSLKLNSTKTPRTIDLIPLDGGGRKTAVGIYSLVGDAWTLCISFRGTARPTEMLANKDLDHTVLTLKKGSPAATPLGLTFDFKAWQQASGKLEAMKVRASLEQWDRYAGTEALTHFALITLPETADGTMSPELWAIVSSISHVAVKTTFATDATLRQLAQHPGLLGINMDTRSTVTVAGIAALKACPHLQMLIFYVPVSPEVCEASAQLEHLRLFAINNSPVSKEMLSSIVRLSQLESLILFNTGNTDEDALQIQKLTKLRTLNFHNSQLTDEGLKTLTSLTQLKTLMIGESQVTDKGLETLMSLAELEFLSLEQTQVTDAGLKSLKSLRGLKRLYMQGLTISPEAVAELKASLPNCTVIK